MSMYLQAPYPGIQTTTVLPDPLFNDTQSLRATVDPPLYAMDGTKYVYVKSNPRSKLQYPLRLSRMKALELRAFLQSYFSAPILLTNHKGELWEVYFTTNPFDFATTERGDGLPGGEIVEITVEVEGILLEGVSPNVCD